MSLKGIGPEFEISEELIAAYFANPENIEAFLNESNIFDAEETNSGSHSDEAEKEQSNDADVLNEFCKLIDELLSNEDISNNDQEKVASPLSAEGSVSHSPLSVASQNDEENEITLSFARSRKSKRDPLEIDTVEGKKMKGHVITDFNRESKNRANIKFKTMF